MKRFGLLVVLCLAIGVSQMSAKTEPEVRVVDNRVSIQADAVPLSQLLNLFDQATGMTSKVPPELANRTISVRFTNLGLNDAISKIFEGQSLDYVLVEGRSIIVTGVAQVINYKNLPPPTPAVAATAQPDPQRPAAANATQRPPATIQTPFGTIANPQSPQAAAPPQQPNAAAATTPPGGVQNQNPFTSTLPGFISPNTVENNPTAPAASPAPPSSYPNTVPNNGGVPSTNPNIMPDRINP